MSKTRITINLKSSHKLRESMWRACCNGSNVQFIYINGDEAIPVTGVISEINIESNLDTDAILTETVPCYNTGTK